MEQVNQPSLGGKGKRAGRSPKGESPAHSLRRRNEKEQGWAVVIKKKKGLLTNKSQD